MSERTSEYGFSSWMEKSDADAAANLAAEEVLPILPVLCVRYCHSRELSLLSHTPIVAVNTCKLSARRHTIVDDHECGLPHWSLSSGTCMVSWSRFGDKLFRGSFSEKSVSLQFNSQPRARN